MERAIALPNFVLQQDFICPISASCIKNRPMVQKLQTKKPTFREIQYKKPNIHSGIFRSIPISK